MVGVKGTCPGKFEGRGEVAWPRVVGTSRLSVPCHLRAFGTSETGAGQGPRPGGRMQAWMPRGAFGRPLGPMGRHLAAYGLGRK